MIAKDCGIDLILPSFLNRLINSGPIGREFKIKLQLKQCDHWAHQSTNQRRQALRGTIGSKSCEPQPTFERRGRRSKGGWGSQLFDPMVPLFWFWPLPELIFGFEALKGLGVPTFRPMEPVDEKFWVWPLPELVSGKLVRIYPPVRI